MKSNDTLVRQVFRQVCIEQVEKGREYAWEEIGKQFNERMGFSLPRKVLKHMWDEMRRDYKEWKLLKNLQVRLGVSDNKSIAAADEASWKEHIKRRPRARKFRDCDLEFEEEHDILFSKVVGIGEMKFNSPRGCSPDTNANGSMQKTSMPNSSASHSCLYDDIKSSAKKRQTSAKAFGNKEHSKKRKQQLAQKGQGKHGLVETCCRNHPEKLHLSALEEEMSEMQVLLEKAGLEKGSTLKYFAMSQFIDAARQAMFKSIAPEERLGWLKYEYEIFQKKVG